MSNTLKTTSSLRTCRYLVHFSYIGTKYNGLQRQTKRSVFQDELEDGTIQSALERSINRALHPVYGCRMGTSSRTDAGVHAYSNTFHVDLTHPIPETIYTPSFVTEATNRMLTFNDHEILILGTSLVPSYFHSRINAKWRVYVYRLAIMDHIDQFNLNHSPSRRLSQQMQYQSLRSHLPLSQLNRCHVVGPLDLELMKQSCQILCGTNDFILFTQKNQLNANQTTTIKTIDEFYFNRSMFTSDNRFESRNLKHEITILEFYIKSKSFLYNQVRKMVSAVIDVGLERISLKELEQMLRPPMRKPSSLSQMAPACGLYLLEVGYDNDDLILRDDWNEYSPKQFFDKKLFDQDDDEDEEEFYE
ncbi:tRNA pseudouridine synthase-like 1 [Sarcoptes scabiei]|nr:tRNA pseudouridine synthase-like 1 [Sarcoptes scabiei]